GQLVQRYRVANVSQVHGLEVRGEPLPYLLTQAHGRVHGVYAEQAYAAQDKRHDSRTQRVARREPDAGQGATDLHGAREPRQHITAEIVHGAGPRRLVERLDAGQVEAAAQHDLLRSQALEVVGFCFLAGEGGDVIARLGEDVDSNT